MADVSISEHTKLTGGGADFAALADQAASRVWLWDLGPKKPEMPKRPQMPAGKEGEPAFDLAMVDFREQILDYETAVKAYRADKTAFDAFAVRYGGPYEISMWSADASDALKNDAHRYCISARTRGYTSLKNGGLPVGMKPGKGHAENMRRMAEGDADLAAIKRRDPVFGDQEARQ